MRRFQVQTAPAAYAPLSDYGAIGDGRSVALVSRHGSVDWWCPARFDGPSVFGAILDARHGGRFRVAPTGEARSTMAYAADTNVLVTTHATASGDVRVVDLAPQLDDLPFADGVLVRRVVGLRGVVELGIEFQPRFQYGARAARFEATPDGLVARGAGEGLLLSGVPLAVHGDTAAARVHLRAGERLDLVLRHQPFDAPEPFARAWDVSLDELEARTIARWRAWSSRTRARGPHAAAVRRAALTLKLLQDVRTGAIIAAPTTSLPEAIGGPRNWDYRYAWLRDGSLCARALADAGHEDDADAFTQWLARVLDRAPEEARVLYSIGGEGDLPERALPHLEGYRSSRPVRIGNAAATQRQLDVSGEILDYLSRTTLPAGAWPRVRELADLVARTWRPGDQGIWEMRCEPRHFVLSKAMACVALERASDMADARGEPSDAWRGEAATIRADVLANGVRADGAFVQAYGCEDLDASNLLLGLAGFVDVMDPRMLQTVQRTIEELTVDGLVYRYLDLDADGVGGPEATFTYCTFWLVEILAKQGRVEEASSLFERTLARATPLGLYAEEIDPLTREHLGNFPQGFPHAGLLQAARAIDAATRSV